MTEDDFIEGEWYVNVNHDGRARSHFYQTIGSVNGFASSSCGMCFSLSSLRKSDKTTNPRLQCGTCWRAELAKGRRT